MSSRAGEWGSWPRALGASRPGTVPHLCDWPVLWKLRGLPLMLCSLALSAGSIPTPQPKPRAGDPQILILLLQPQPLSWELYPNFQLLSKCFTSTLNCAKLTLFASLFKILTEVSIPFVSWTHVSPCLPTWVSKSPLAGDFASALSARSASTQSPSPPHH